MVHAPRLESRLVKCGVNVNFKLPGLKSHASAQGGVETDVAGTHNGDISPLNTQPPFPGIYRLFITPTTTLYFLAVMYSR